MKTRHITLNGETLSLKEWAVRLGISRGALHSRLSKGWALERALSVGFTEAKRTKLYTFQGKTQDLKTWARDLGISKKSLAQRLRKFSVEEAFTRSVLIRTKVEGLEHAVLCRPEKMERMSVSLFSTEERKKIDAIKACRAGCAA